MNIKLDDLIAQVMTLPLEDRRHLAQLLRPVYEIRDVEGVYNTLPKELLGMTAVTVVLPDDLAKQAQAAGLLAEACMTDLIRRALKEQRADPSSASATHQRRRLVRENGRLVVEAHPNEPQVTDAQIADVLNRME